MGDICKRSGVQEYTAHCLRPTAIECMNAGNEARHIMYMSGYKQESSIRPYNTYVSTEQNKCISYTLAAVVSGDSAPSSHVVGLPLGDQLSRMRLAGNFTASPGPNAITLIFTNNVPTPSTNFFNTSNNKMNLRAFWTPLPITVQLLSTVCKMQATNHMTFAVFKTLG